MQYIVSMTEKEYDSNVVVLQCTKRFDFEICLTVCGGGIVVSVYSLFQLILSYLKKNKLHIL